MLLLLSVRVWVEIGRRLVDIGTKYYTNMRTKDVRTPKTPMRPVRDFQIDREPIFIRDLMRTDRTMNIEKKKKMFFVVVT